MTIAARSTLPARVGQQLTLQVAALGDTIVLRQRHDAAASAPLQQALARDLPRHASLNEVLSLLRGLHQLSAIPARPSQARSPLQPALTGNSGGLADAPISSGLRPLVTAYVAALPHANSATDATTVRESIRMALQPLEQKLLRAGRREHPVRAAGLETDLRALLGRVLRFVEAMPAPKSGPAQAQAKTSGPEQVLSQAVQSDTLPARLVPIRGDQIDAVLARSRAQQVIALQASADTAVPLLADVPVRHGNNLDLWHFEIAREPGSAKAAPDAPRGRIKIRLQLSDTIAFDAEVSGNEHGLRVCVGAEHQSFSRIIENNLAVLRQRLDSCALPQSTVTCGARPPLDLSRHRQPLINDAI